MSRIKRFAAFLLLTAIILAGYLVICSSSLESLEKDVISKSDIKVISVGQYEFGIGGLALVGVDKKGNGILKTYTKIPVIKRFMNTDDFCFKNQHDTVSIVGESWAGYQVLSYRDGKLHEDSGSSGMGFGKRLLQWFLISALLSCLIIYGPTIKKNICKNKEA